MAKSDVLGCQVRVSKQSFQYLEHEHLEEIILNDVSSKMAQKMLQSGYMTIVEEEDMARDEMIYTSKIAILSVSEYKRLKAIERDFIKMMNSDKPVISLRGSSKFAEIFE